MVGLGFAIAAPNCIIHSFPAHHSLEKLQNSRIEDTSPQLRSPTYQYPNFHDRSNCFHILEHQHTPFRPEYPSSQSPHTLSKMTPPTSDPTKSGNTPPALTPQDTSQGAQADRTVPVPPASPHSGSLSHRSSFADGMRPHPPSPRNQRHPSLSQAAVQELLNNPTPLNKPDARFKGRDWRSIEIGELVNTDDVRFVETNTSVEEATNVSPLLAIRELRS